MKIEILLSEKDMDHINNCDGDSDTCGTWYNICKKIRKQVKIRRPKK